MNKKKVSAIIDDIIISIAVAFVCLLFAAKCYDSSLSDYDIYLFAICLMLYNITQRIIKHLP